MATRLLVRSYDQTAQLWRGDDLVREYRISTARNGLGCRSESLCTPTGRLRIAKKFGAGMPLGMVFRDREPTGEIWSSHPDNPLFASPDDLILTRVLWLEGAEPANLNTLDRQIYLQGTNREGLLGTADSTGSIRFSNADIIELFELLEEGDEVSIL